MSLWSINIFILFIYIIHPILKKRTKKYQLALYPYSQIGSDGHTRRFLEYLPYLEKDNISYEIFNVCMDSEYRDLNEDDTLKKSSFRLKAYVFYLKVYLKRINQTLKIRNFKNAFIQRGLFPYYFYHKYPFLEKLAFKLCDNIIIDFWDAVWLGNKSLIDNTIKYAHKITVVNQFLYDYFSSKHKNVIIYTIGINLSHYKLKSNYELINNECLTIAYTGLPGHTENMFKILDPVFEELLKNINLKIILISQEKYDHPFIQIDHYKFNMNTFFDLLKKTDLGIYAINNSDYSKGKLTMKTLDYAACGIPQVSSPYGASPYFKSNRDVIFAENKNQWIDAFQTIYKSKKTRKNLGFNSNKIIKEFHELSNSYKVFKKINNLKNGQ